MEEKIANFTTYNKRMEKSLKDKLFFLDVLKDENIKNIIDFGCANGELLKWTNENWNKYGIDNNSEMRLAAKENNPSGEYFASFEDIPKVINKEETVLNICSVIHEIYSYCSNDEITDFWDHVFNDGYKYIVIRDMSVSKKTERIADSNLIENILNRVLNDKNDIKNMKRMMEHFDFCQRWVNKESPNIQKEHIRQKDAIHYLLKYRYVDNWKREVAENYLNLWLEDLLALVPEKYEIIYQNHYVLPFIKENVIKNFNYELKDETHIQLVLKKKN